MDKNWELINRMNIEKLMKDSGNWTQEEWDAVLQQAPIESMFDAIKDKMTMILDINRMYANVPNSIERMYAKEKRA
ncbi:MAG: hypothetical protein IKT30_06650 [Bacteroidaceae bacterium]|nr:hypothetical protein [Bacteroidaceae bacterium]